MKTKLNLIQTCLLGVALLALPATAEAQFDFTTDHGTITITGYTGPSGVVIIPSIINGLSVISTGDFAFAYRDVTDVTIPNSVTSFGMLVFNSCTNLTSVNIGSGITSIGIFPFDGCTSLTGIYFSSNAPTEDFFMFAGVYNATVYYVAGTIGWGSTFSGLPTALWNLPTVISMKGANVRANQFGFTFNRTNGQIVVVEACTNLASHLWTPIATNTFTSSSAYFSNLQWTNYPCRFYRVVSPES